MAADTSQGRHPLTNPTYRTDFYAWTQEQAALLQAEELEKLDLPNLIEEIESLGKRDKRELASRLSVLLTHLLKLRYQLDRKGNSWLRTIRTQRRNIMLVLKDSPSLRREVPDFIADAYPGARKDAAIETKLDISIFPINCPWGVEDVLDDDWLPEDVS